MSSLSWIILSAVLLVTATATTVGLRKTSAAPLPDIENVSTDKNNDRRPQVSPQMAPRQNAAMNSTGNGVSDDIWQKSLFRPDRTEEVANNDNDGENAIDQRQANSEFELVGIAQIGTAGQSQPIAVIRQRGGNAPNGGQRSFPGMFQRPGIPANQPGRGQNPQVRPFPFGPGAPPAGGAPGQPPQGNNTEQKLKTTFKVGDAINQTGYILTDIDIANDSVTLNRNGEDLVLTIILGDAQSLQRKEIAVSGAAERRQQLENNAAPPPPQQPVPPPQPPQPAVPTQPENNQNGRPGMPGFPAFGGNGPRGMRMGPAQGPNGGPPNNFMPNGGQGGGGRGRFQGFGRGWPRGGGRPEGNENPRGN